MSLSAAEFLLIVLAQGSRRIEGRTLLQKRIYFVQRLIEQELVSFKPHFYGPFSPEIDSALGLLVELGFVQENERVFGSSVTAPSGRVRYDYSLTNNGDLLASRLISNHANLALQIESSIDRISCSGDLDYSQLSLAAKIAHIVASEDRKWSIVDISSRAGDLGWNVSPETVMPVAKFLESLGLIEVRQAQER